MSRRFLRGTRLPLAAIGLWVVAVWTLPAAAEPPQDALIQAHIAAGEFAPAIALAQQAADPQQRDAWLAEIATAQARAGNRDASLRSAAEIGDDRVRAATLSTAAAVPLGGQGGGNEPDFDSLMELITTTVQPSTWDGVGGPGSMSKFPTGVYVDAQGVLKPLVKEELAGRLAALHAASRPRGGGDDARRNSPLRMVSLTRLEKQIQLLLAAGRQPTEEMQVLAGLQRIQYVFVYPESGDLVLAGPAGDWKPGPEDIVVSSDTGQPVVRLDDLVVVLRLMTSGRDAQFGCLITPRPAGLARVQAFVKQSNQRAISPEERPAWLEKVRAQLGKQDIEVYGLDPAHAGGPGNGRGRLSHEAGGHGPGAGRARREKLSGVGGDTAGPGAACLGRVARWFTLNYDALAPPRTARHSLCAARG